MLERLDDDDLWLYSEDESDCEAEEISGYISEADYDLMTDIVSGNALDDEEEGNMDADDAASSALTTSLESSCRSVLLATLRPLANS